MKPELIPVHKCSSSPQEECHLKFSPNIDVPEDKPLIKRFCLRKDIEENIVEKTERKDDFREMPIIPKARKLEISQDFEVDSNSIPIEYPEKDLIEPLDEVLQFELIADGSDEDIETTQAPMEANIDEDSFTVDEENSFTTSDALDVIESGLANDDYILQDGLDSVDETTFFDETYMDNLTTISPLQNDSDENVTLRTPERKDRKITKSTSYSVSVVQPPLTSYSVGPIGGAK